MIATFLLFAAAQDQYLPPPIDRADTHGKSAAQIVAMGHDDWYGFYVGKEGESTVGMCGAEALWGQAMFQTNTPLIAKQPASRAANLTALRKNMPLFREKCINVAFVISGGGTMWNPVYSARWGSSEEVVAYLLLGKGPKPKAAKQAAVWTQLATGRKGLTGLRKEIEDRVDTTGTMYRDALKSLDEASRLWSQAITVIGRLPEKERPVVFGFYMESAKIIEVEPLQRT